MSTWDYKTHWGVDSGIATTISTIGDDGEIVEHPAQEWLVIDPGGNIVAALLLHPDAQGIDALIAAKSGCHLLGRYDDAGEPWDRVDADLTLIDREAIKQAKGKR